MPAALSFLSTSDHAASSTSSDRFGHTRCRTETAASQLGLAAQFASQFRDFRRSSTPDFALRRNRRFLGRSPRFVRSGMLVQADPPERMKTCFRQGPAPHDRYSSRRYYVPLRFLPVARRRLCFPANGHEGLARVPRCPDRSLRFLLGPGLSTPAVPSTPGSPTAAFARCFAVGNGLHPLWRVGRSRLSRGRNGFTLRITAGVVAPRASLDGSPRRTPGQLHGYEQALMTTFQLIKLNRLTDAPKLKIELLEKSLTGI